jgi:hypothetical protein
MDGSVNVAFFCQKLATVNANLQHNGQGFTFGLTNGAAARTVFNKVKTMARQEMCLQMLAQDTGGGAELADNPNEWPDAKEPRHTANGALWPHARRDADADGLLTLAVNALAYEWDAYAAAEKAHEDSLKEKARAKKRKTEPVAPAGGNKNNRLKAGQAARTDCLDVANEGGGGPGADEEEESGAAADGAPQSGPRLIPGSTKGATKKTASKTLDTRGLRATGRSLDTQGSGGGGSKVIP